MKRNKSQASSYVITRAITKNTFNHDLANVNLTISTKKRKKKEKLKVTSKVPAAKPKAKEVNKVNR